MPPPSIQKLIELFSKLPGVGPRQASRFAYYLLKDQNGLASDLALTISEAKNKTTLCGICFRTIEKDINKKPMCNLCSNDKRDQTAIAVVEKESDMHNLEKTGVHYGLYHVLGGIISPLDAESPKKIRIKELFERVKNSLETSQKAEVVLATSATTEGDTTALYIERVLMVFKDKHPGFKISRLGRGLSLGSELEYADETTLKNAFLNRK